MSDLRIAAQQALEALEYDGLLKKRQAITALRAALAQEQAEPDAYPYASRLAASIWERHYKGEAPNWKPLDDLLGVLTQIDNMTAGLTRQGQEQAEPVAWLYEAGTDRTLHWQEPPLYGTPLYTAPPKADPVQEQATPQQSLPIRATVFDDAHPNGIPLEQWVRQNRPAQRQPLSGLEVERLLEQVIGSLPAARNLVRAVERAHGIIEPRIEEDSHQTLDDAMRLPRAMAQAYENGYKAGVAHERERCLRLIDEHVRAVDAEDLVRAIKEGKE